MGCRLDKSCEHAVRCMHEASLHAENTFITLTYSDENIPPGGTLKHEDFQLFMKRLRKQIGPKKVKYFMAGEYGDERLRPHYHVLLFGHDFSADRYAWRRRRGILYYRSASLEKAWTEKHATERIGNCEFSIDVNFKNAAYVARYITKKITGEKTDEHYGGREPEYCAMSRGGRTGRGIAYDWFQKYSSDIFPDDFVVVAGRKIRTPKYYFNLLAETNPETAAEIKTKRLEKMKQQIGENTRERLDAREVCTKARLTKLKRPLEAS